LHHLHKRIVHSLLRRVRRSSKSAQRILQILLIQFFAAKLLGSFPLSIGQFALQ
jgi:hypothetical protein